MNDAYWDFLSEVFWPEWFGQGCPMSENGDPILYEEEEEHENEDEL